MNPTFEIVKKSFFEYKWIIWLGFISLFVYIVYRAFTFSFTHDESLSYTIIKGVEYQRNTANNHVLNTFLMDWSSRLFGHSELSLRLPNILAFVLYLLAAFLLLRKKNNKLAFLGASLLCLNPYLLEYFSLARGYGISFGLMLMSLYFTVTILFKFETNHSNLSKYFFAILFASLATNANLSMINFLIALIGFFTIHYAILSFKFKRRSFIQHLPFILLLFAGIVVVYFESQRLFLLQENNQLYFGENSLNKMFESISRSSIYSFKHFHGAIQGTKYVVLASLIFGAILVRWKKEYNSPLFILGTLILFILLGLVLEATFFKSKYPSGRSAFFFVPLYTLYLYFLIEKTVGFFNLKNWFFIPIFLLLPLPIFTNFYYSTLIKFNKDWEFDAETKEMMAFLKSETKKNNQLSTIANHWLFEPSINYYIESQKINLAPATRNPIDFTTDYIYRLEDDSKVEGYQIVLEFPQTKTNLLRRMR
ncbi:MAG: glycosyltransferase family 39 protein [Crocinitomicaceae bacterium]